MTFFELIRSSLLAEGRSIWPPGDLVQAVLGTLMEKGDKRARQAALPDPPKIIDTTEPES